MSWRRDERTCARHWQCVDGIPINCEIHVFLAQISSCGMAMGAFFGRCPSPETLRQRRRRFSPETLRQLRHDPSRCPPRNWFVQRDFVWPYLTNRELAGLAPTNKKWKEIVENTMFRRKHGHLEGVKFVAITSWPWWVVEFPPDP